jgi:hypothetical protein
MLSPRLIRAPRPNQSRNVHSATHNEEEIKNTESMERRMVRQGEIENSRTSAQEKLKRRYEKKFADLVAVQKIQVLNLRQRWAHAHAKAVADDDRASNQVKATAAILLCCGNQEAATSVLASPRKSPTAVDKYDSRYHRLMTLLLQRHQSELDWMVRNFHSEMALLNEEYTLVSARIDDQYKIEVAGNGIPTRTRPLQTVSPRSQIRAQQRANCQCDALSTPITARTRPCPRTD